MELALRRGKEFTVNKPLVIYHDNCMDGFASALVAWKRFGDDAEYFPCNYNNYKFFQNPEDESLTLKYKDQITDIFDRALYILDFSFKRDEINKHFGVCSRVAILDHHKTAEEELRGMASSKLLIEFNMNRSGCMLAWDNFFPGIEMPTFIKLVGLRDLWQHKGSVNEAACESLNLFLGSANMNFTVWNDFLKEQNLCEIIDQGAAIKRFFDQKVNEEMSHVRNCTGLNCYMVNAPYWMASELGNRIAKEHPDSYAIIFGITLKHEVWCSLRSVGDIDVSAIAKRYGGGGHKNAAGCSFRTWRDFEAFAG